jgi:hypothetical protein
MAMRIFGPSLFDLSIVIASEAKQSIARQAGEWIASLLRASQ